MFQRQLHDLKQVIGDPAQKDAGPVHVKETEGKLLHMSKHIGTHVRLDQGPVAVADHRYLILEKGPQQIGSQNSGHNREKSRIHSLRKETVHGLPGDIGKGKVNEGDHSGQKHVQREELPVGKHVGDKNGKIRFGEVFFCILHSNALLAIYEFT